MARLDIPEEYREGLAKFAALPDEAFQELFSALEGTPPALKYSDVARNVAAKVKSIPGEDVEEIVEIIVSLNIVRHGADVTDGEFLEDVLEGLDETDLEELHLTGAVRENFKGRFAKLLGTTSLKVAARVRSLQIEHDRRFCSARILTDIRPVFGLNPEDSPMAAVVTNTLRVSYHQDSELKDVYLVLTADDLKKLRESIERAEKKALSLKAVLDTAKVPYLE
jgi:hypothetical protein